MNAPLNFSSGRAFLALLLLVCASYINTLYSPLILDDLNSFVLEPNVYLKAISFEEIAKVAQTRFGMARMVPMLSFALNHYLANGNIVFFHLTNIAIHLLACWALFIFIKALLRTETGKRSLRFLQDPGRYALYVTALWALSPVQTNAVTYLVQRMTSMAALFYLASLACYLHGRLANGNGKRILFFVGAALAGCLAFLSKENSATLPLAILLVECIFLSPGLAGRILNGPRWYHWSLLAVILLVFLPLGQHPWQVLTDAYNIREFTLPERLFTQLRVVVFYISLLILPLPGRLNLDHDFTISSSLLSPPSTLLAGIFLLALLGVAVLLRKRSPLIALGILWFFLHLVIESSVVPLELVFEHRLYLPSVGFYMALVAALDWFAVRLSPRRSVDAQKILLLLMIILSSLSSLLTTVRNDDWRDSLAIYEDCYNKAPNKSRTSANFGMVLIREGKIEEARVALERAMDLGRLNAEEYINTANNILASYLKEERYEEAVSIGEKYFARMTRKMDFSGFDNFMRNWGYAYQQTDRYVEALETYVTGMLHTTRSVPLLKKIEQLFVEAGKSEQGRKELGLGGEEIDVPLQMVNVLLRLRLYDLAGGYLDRARELDSENPQMLRYEQQMADEQERNHHATEQFDIANDETYQSDTAFRNYMMLARFIRSYYQPLTGSPLLWLIKQAQAIAPDNPFVILYRAQWDKQHGNYQEFGQQLVDGVALHPDFVPLLEKLGMFYYSSRRPDLAAEKFARLLDLYPGIPNRDFYVQIIRAEQERKRNLPTADKPQGKN